MAHGDADLDMNEGVVAEVVKDLIELRATLDQGTPHATGDDVTAGEFGRLAQTIGAGATYVGVRDPLRASYAKLLPYLDELIHALDASAKATTETEAEVAMHLRNADGGK